MSLKTTLLRSTCLATAIGMAVGAASATPVTSGAGTVAQTDPTMAARVFRDGSPPPAWTSPKAFPGSVAGTFHYDEIPVAFAPNALQTVFYEIGYADTDRTFEDFAAYRDDFIPGSLATNYLGDAGSSATFPNSITFQVIVPAGGSLVLSISDVGTIPTAYSYTVNAFSDINRGEDFGAVPEPSSLTLIALGCVGLLGSYRRRRSG